MIQAVASFSHGIGSAGVLFVLVFVTTASGVGQDRTVQTGCVPKLPQLKYPKTALEKRIMGLVTAEFSVEEHGVATRIESKGHPLLVAGADAAIQSGIFERTCEGKRLVMQFKFRLDQDLEPTTPVVIRSEGPMVYEIVSPVDRIIMTIYDPPMYGTKTLRARVFGWLAKLRFW